MKTYFKRETQEMPLGDGFVYYEFDGEWATRQVENYGDKWFCSNVDYHPGLGPALVDQPLSELEMNDDDEITQEEFESIWKIALEKSA